MDRLIAWRVCRHLGLFIALLPIVPAVGLAQTVGSVLGGAPSAPPMQGQPPRDRVPAAPRVGTAVIRGRVVDGVTGNPVARARVRIMSGPAGPKGPILTDATGTFEITALPSGPYNVMVEKSTYLPGRYPEMNRSMRARMQPLILRDGQVIDDLAIPLFHGSAIAGRVLDAHGDPVEFAQVRVLRVQRGARPTSASQMATNDLGEFRVPRLQPGRYLLQIRPQMQQQSYASPSVVEPPQPQPVPAYYPNAPDMAQAQVITLNRGETVAGLEMTLAEGMPGVVTGVVLRSDGEPVAGGSLNARVSGTDAAGGYDNSGGTGIRQGGSFQLTLPPGEYTLEAQVMRRQGTGAMSMGPEDQMFGSARISVGGGATEAVSIMVGRGATATGRVVFEGATPPPPSPGQARVPFYNPDGPGCRSGQAIIAADWSFKLDGLNGLCGAPPTSGFGRWTLKAVMFRGQNLLEQPLTFETGQQYTDVQVVVTDKRTQMDLLVSGDDGQPTREYVALAFPVDKAKWNPQLRRVRTHVPSPVSSTTGGGGGTAMATPSAGVAAGAIRETYSTGGFAMSGGAGASTGPQDRIVALAPGEYYVVAVDDMDAEDTLDPAVLERLAASAVRVTVSDEAPVEVPLRRVSFAEVMR